MWDVNLISECDTIDLSVNTNMFEPVLTVRTEPSNDQSGHRYLKLDLVCTQVLFCIDIDTSTKSSSTTSWGLAVLSSNRNKVTLNTSYQYDEVNKVVTKPLT